MNQEHQKEEVAGGNGEGSGANQLAIPMGVAVNKMEIFILLTYKSSSSALEKGSTEGKTLISAKDFKDGYKTNYFSGISIVNDLSLHY